MTGWQSVKLGNVCDVLDSLRRPITKRDRVAGPIPYYGASGVLDYVVGQLFDEPLVLLGEDGAKWESGANSAFAISGPSWVNNHAHVLRPRRAQLDDAWLIYFLNFADLLPFVTGLTVPKLNQEMMRKIPIPLPPLAEQQRAVAILDETFDGIATAAAMVEKQFGKIGEFSSASRESIFRSVGGTQQKLADHVDMLVGFAFKSSEYVDGEDAIRLLRGDNVTPGGVRWSDAKFLARDRMSEFSRYRLDVDDVVIAMDRPWIKSGLKQARLTENDLPSLLVQRVARLRCRSTIDVGYLQHIIASPMFESHVLEHAGGSGVPHISGGQLGAFSFPLPELDEQYQVIRRLDEVQNSSADFAKALSGKLAALTELKQSLLARAFSGELTREPLAA